MKAKWYMSAIAVAIALTVAGTSAYAASATKKITQECVVTKTVTTTTPCSSDKATKPRRVVKKAVAKKKEVRTLTTNVASAIQPFDCGEIHFWTKGEPAVVVPFFTSGNPSIVTSLDGCMAKNSALVDAPREASGTFARAVKVLHKPLVMLKVFLTPKAGEHVLYVKKEFLGIESGILTGLMPVRGKPMPIWVATPQYSPVAAMNFNKEVASWMSRYYADFICVDAPSYSMKGVGIVYYSKAEMPAGVNQPMYYPDLGTSLFY